MRFSKKFKDTADAYLSGARLIIEQGGTRSGKTYKILQLLVIIANSKPNQIISVISHSMPHLKKGAIRDFKKIIADFNLSWRKYHGTDNIYTFSNGSIIEFFSADDDQKVKGPARDILFVNECDRLKYDTFRQLAQRTSGTIFLDFNPVCLFWVNTKIIQNNQREHILIHSTYLDNIENLSNAQIEEIESNKNDENWWRIYGLGLMGFAEDLLFQEADLKRFSMLEIDIKKADYIVAYIDTADRGKDYFSMPIGAVFGREIYIFDIVFNQQLLGNNEVIATEKIKRYNIDFCVIETNREGSYFIGKMQELSPTTNFHPIVHTKSHGTKEYRIQALSHYILDRFYFLKEVQPNSNYDTFMFNLTTYSQLAKNDNDDAPDSCAGLGKFCRNYLEI